MSRIAQGLAKGYGPERGVPDANVQELRLRVPSLFDLAHRTGVPGGGYDGVDVLRVVAAGAQARIEPGEVVPHAVVDVRAQLAAGGVVPDGDGREQGGELHPDALAEPHELVVRDAALDLDFGGGGVGLRPPGALVAA